MKTTLVLPLHSCVSLITNSSSELFICGKKKTQEMIKDLVTELYRQFCARPPEEDERDPAPVESLWVTVLQEPQVADLNFLPLKMSKEVREALHALRKEDDYSNKEMNDLYAKERAAIEDLRAKFHAAGKQTGYAGGKPIDPKAEKEFSQKSWKVRDRLWEPWGKAKQKKEYEVFCAFLEQNGIDRDGFPKLETPKGRWSSLFAHQKLNEEGARVYNFFRLCMSYRIQVAKGQILLYSAEDNSIPWEFQEILERELSADRHHIG